MGSATCRNCCRSTFSTQQGGSRHSAMSDGVSLLHQQTNKPANQQTSKPAKYVTTKVASPGSPGQAGLKNVEGKARRRRQYACTQGSRNAAIGIFSGPRLRPAVSKFLRFNLSDLTGTHPGLQPSHHKKRQAPITGTCLERQPTA